MSFEQAPRGASAYEDIGDFLTETGADKGEDAPGRKPAAGAGAEPDDDAPGADDADKGDDENPEDDRPSDDPDADPDEPQGDDEEGEGSDKAKGSTSDLTVKVKIPVKGEDGSDSFKEVTLKELVDGNMMREDYTRKTQELSTRERQAYETVSTRLNQGLSYYEERANFAIQAITQLADLKDEAAMFQLARTLTPEQFQQEQARQQFVRNTLNTLNAAVQQDKQRHQAEIEKQTGEARKSAMQACWGALGHHGINGDMVKGAFEHAMKAYGVPAERFENISDPALVRLMVSAHKWDQAQAKAKTVTREPAKKTPVLQTQRQQPPQNTRATQRLEKKFSSGRAKLGDLAEAITRMGG